MITRANRIVGKAAVVGLLLLVPILLSAGRQRKNPVETKPTAETLEMFAGMDSGEIQVKFTARNDHEAKVRIKNNTKRPLSVRLPEAFAASPVLAQNQGGGRNNRNNNNNNNNNNNGMNQGMGGGMGMGMGMGGMGMGGMGGGGMGGMGGGGGFFNVAPEAEGQIQLEVLCLEHGKRNPRASVSYEIKPIESATNNVALQEFLKLFGHNQGRINHQAAQAAAWHFSDNLSWEQLAAKRRTRLGGISEPYFSAADLQDAMLMVEQSITQARQRSVAPTSTSASTGQ